MITEIFPIIHISFIGKLATIEMTRQGRELELLIERVEKAVLPEGATIQSPWIIKDRITNQPREVDILIEYTIGTTPIRIIIECRDRTSTQDTQWIEQIQPKVGDLKANKVIAVSSSAFTEAVRTPSET